MNNSASQPAPQQSPTPSAPNASAPKPEPNIPNPSTKPKARPALVFYILYVQMFAMFATDMYTPALPDLITYFATSESLVNLTLMVFFAFMLVGMLIFGPLSDKYGRKPILYAGCALFTCASLACAFATTIGMLIGARIIQALATGMVEVVGMTLIKDCFDGKRRETILLWAQAAFVLGPIAAPLIGAQVLLFFSWRATFVILAALGLLGFGMTAPFKESLPVEARLTEGSLASSLKGLLNVAKSRSFTVFMLVTCVFVALPFMAYLTTAPYIYEGFFGLSAQEFSYCFGATVALSIVGIPLYKLASGRVPLRVLTPALVIISGAAGVAMMLLGRQSLIFFLVCVLILYITSMIIRPYSTNILLEMRSVDVGSASSVMNCSYTICGLLGTLPVILLGADNIGLLGALMLLGALISLGLWVYLVRAKLAVKGVTTP
jgi:DHA1 family bicyclomycin/chloramphenicol resistance-like MFS transporter